MSTLTLWLTAPHPTLARSRLHPSTRRSICFFFNDTAPTEIYTLSLHDALPISRRHRQLRRAGAHRHRHHRWRARGRSEEHTSELQSLRHLVCRLLLEKKKKLKRKDIAHKSS